MPAADVIAATQRSLQALNPRAIDDMASEIARSRCVPTIRGRLFILGNGGGAAHASHAACDFRKLCGIEAYCPTDNAAELTARVNDEGFDTSYAEWLRASRVQRFDTLLIISVGGGSREPPVSMNLVNAIVYAESCGAEVLAIVGDARTPSGGFAGGRALVSVVIPCDVPQLVTPVVEGVQAVVLHALAVHPLLQKSQAKWEGMQT